MGITMSNKAKSMILDAVHQNESFKAQVNNFCAENGFRWNKELDRFDRFKDERGLLFLTFEHPVSHDQRGAFAFVFLSETGDEVRRAQFCPVFVNELMFAYFSEFAGEQIKSNRFHIFEPTF